MTTDDLIKFIPLLKKNECIDEFSCAVHQFVQDNRQLQLQNYGGILQNYNIDNLDNVNVGKLDEKCLLAILVCCVRGDRFCEDFLRNKIANGLVIKCLKQLEKSKKI